MDIHNCSNKQVYTLNFDNLGIHIANNNSMKLIIIEGIQYHYERHNGFYTVYRGNANTSSRSLLGALNKIMAGTLI
jgi:hypothetical protein